VPKVLIQMINELNRAQTKPKPPTLPTRRQPHPQLRPNRIVHQLPPQQLPNIPHLLRRRRRPAEPLLLRLRAPLRVQHAQHAQQPAEEAAVAAGGGGGGEAQALGAEEGAHAGEL